MLGMISDGNKNKNERKKKTEEKGMKTTGDIPQSGYNQKKEEVIILKRKRMRIVYKSSYWFPRGKRDHK